MLYRDEFVNSIDWAENLTALEYTAATGWQLYHYALNPAMQLPDLDTDDPLLTRMLAEFNIPQG